MKLAPHFFRFVLIGTLTSTAMALGGASISKGSVEHPASLVAPVCITATVSGDCANR